MKKRFWRMFEAVMLSIALLAVAVSFAFDKERTAFVEEEDLRKPENCIEGYAGPKNFGYFVADLIEYEVVIVYCDNLRIETERLLRALNVEPFDAVGEARISRKSVSNGTSRIILTKMLQAIDVFPGEEYKFDEIPVEYLDKELGTGHIYWIRDIAPIYISRFVSEDSVRTYFRNPENFDFKPPKGRIIRSESKIFHGALIFSGTLLILFGASELIFTVRPKKIKRVHKKSGYWDRILSRIQEIESEGENDPRHALHQLYNLSQTILNKASKDMARQIEEAAKSIEFKAYSKNEPSLKDVEDSVRGFKNILTNDLEEYSDREKWGGDA